MKPRQDFYTDEDYSKYLRAYYAGQALAGMVAAPHTEYFDFKTLSFQCVELADALINELHKPQE